MTLPVHVALIDDTHSIAPEDLQAVAGGLNMQMQDDVVRHWTPVRATVGVQTTVMPGQWSIRLRDRLDEPGALGYHVTDEHNQPVSYVQAGDDWSITASHEFLEMIVDPSGNRLHGARLPRGLEASHKMFGLPHDSSHVLYLLEVADPCEARSYEVGGVQMSDFLLPSWYRTSPSPAAIYSHAGMCTAARHVAAGGYASFATPAGEWFQVFADRRGALSVQDIGRFDSAAFASLREFTDARARRVRA
jgi:hypothetical protein